MDARDIKRPSKIIGLVQVRVRGGHDIKDTTEYLKVEARKMGGDALIELSSQIIEQGRPVPGGGTAYDEWEIWTAKVIVWE